MAEGIRVIVAEVRIPVPEASFALAEEAAKRWKEIEQRKRDAWLRELMADLAR